MLGVALAPELILWLAVRNFSQARALLGYLVTHGGDEWTLVHAEFAVAGGMRVKSPESDEIEPDVDGSSLRKAVVSGQINEPPISKEELKSRSKSDGIVKFIALLQITWFGLQALFRAIQHLQVTALEIMTVAFFFLTVLIYGIWWNRPQGIEYPIIIKLQNADATGAEGSRGENVDTKSRGTTKRWFTHDKNAAWAEGSRGENVDTKSRGTTKRWFTDDKYAAWAEADEAFFMILAFIAPLFGAIHCLAWDAPFPTSKEALAWRICAVATTTLPFVDCALFLFAKLNVVRGSRYDGSMFERFLLIIPMALYAIARITLITLAFMSLRALPADAFQTIAWTNYVPNLGI